MYKGHHDVSPNIYEHCKRLIEEQALDVKLFVDFGARHGESLNVLGKYCQGDYVFVEPAPKSISIIRDLIKNRKNTYLIDAIVSSEPGTIELFTFEHDDDQSANVFSDRSGRYGEAKIETVKVVSYEIFDELFPNRRIDLAKINIEGGEYKMIDDGFIQRYIDAFVFELHNEHVPGKSWKDAVAGLETDFDIVTYGSTSYKYCFMTGVRCK